MNELHLTLWPKEAQSLPEGFKLIFSTFFFFSFSIQGLQCSQLSMMEASASVWSDLTVKVWSLAHVKEPYPFIWLDAAVFVMLWHLHEKVERFLWKQMPFYAHMCPYFLDSLLYTLLFMWHHYYRYIALALCCRSLTHQCPCVQWNRNLISSKNPIHRRLIHDLLSTGGFKTHSLIICVFV